MASNDVDVRPTAPPRNLVGVDIGGANIKLHRWDDSTSVDVSFPMWRVPETLADRLASELTQLGHVESLAVTMTGELADCFVDRREGVHHIIEHTQRAARACRIRELGFYSTEGVFLSAARAREQVDRVAAANWHALARGVGGMIAADALLVDIGSTTTDVIAIKGGEVLTNAWTDHERLREGSLVYVGCRRTPVCALVEQLHLRGAAVPVMKEVFATIDDARLLRREQTEVADDCETADGRPRDIASAKGRLARMIGLGRDECSDEEFALLSGQVIDAAARRLHVAAQAAWRHLLAHGACSPMLVLSGHGQDLLRPIESAPSLDLRVRLGQPTSRSAPAWALCALWNAHCPEPEKFR